MENLRLYYANRILEKRIAIAEILNSAECQQDKINDPTQTFVVKSPAPVKRKMSDEARRNMSVARTKDWANRKKREAAQRNGGVRCLTT